MSFYRKATAFVVGAAVTLTAHADSSGAQAPSAYERRCEQPSFISLPENKLACLKACSDAQFFRGHKVACKELSGYTPPPQKVDQTPPPVQRAEPIPAPLPPPVPFPECARTIPNLYEIYRKIEVSITAEGNRYKELLARKPQQIKDFCEIKLDEMRQFYVMSTQANQSVQDLAKRFDDAQHCQGEVLTWLRNLELTATDIAAKERMNDQIKAKLKPIEDSIGAFKNEMVAIEKAKAALAEISRYYEIFCGEKLTPENRR